MVSVAPVAGGRWPVAGGKVAVYHDLGSTDVIADVAGWFAAAP